MTLQSAEIAPFEILPPVGPAGPLVFASPHSGSLYPPDMGADPALRAGSLRSAEDALVDRLIATGPARGASVVLGRIGRAYVDLNRDADELDPSLIEGVATTRGGARVAAGYGVVARIAGDGVPLYSRALSLAEVEGRIARVHTPYHDALTHLMNEARDRHGVAVLIDWHSMPSRAGANARGVRPLDVVLGDRHGASCGGRLTRCLRTLFEAAGWRVGLNQPYAGGFTTQLWGRPQAGFHAVQIELNRGLYLDETTGTEGPGFDRAQRVVERVIAGIAAEAWTRG